MGWTDSHLELRHKGCSEFSVPDLACPVCGEWVSARDVETVALK